MRRLKLMVTATGAAAAMVIGLAGPASAADPPGRGASAGGLLNAFGKVSLQDFGSKEVPTESLSLNFVKSQDPEQPGTTPGGGDVEP